MPVTSVMAENILNVLRLPKYLIRYPPAKLPDPLPE